MGGKEANHMYVPRVKPFGRGAVRKNTWGQVEYTGDRPRSIKANNNYLIRRLVCEFPFTFCRTAGNARQFPRRIASGY